MSIGQLEHQILRSGSMLGLVDLLRTSGSMTPAELAQRSGAHVGYVQSWLDTLAASGMLSITSEHRNGTPDTPRYQITKALAELMPEESRAARIIRRLW